jgi:uncharacterized protein (DUF433 family)
MNDLPAGYTMDTQGDARGQVLVVAGVVSLTVLDQARRKAGAWIRKVDARYSAGVLSVGRRCSIGCVGALDSIVHSDPDVLGGTPVFRGTRVPLKNLVDYLAAGDTLEEFLDHFPSVKREQAMAVLELAAKELLPACARPAR